MIDGKPKVIGWKIYPDDSLAVFTLDGEELFTCSVDELKNLIGLGLETYGALRSIVEARAALDNMQVIKEAEEVLKGFG